METYIEWSASISGMIAAFIIAADIGRRATGFGFVLFVFSSIAWIVAALMGEENALMTQNAVLLLINLLGVWRYLLRRPAATQQRSAHS